MAAIDTSADARSIAAIVLQRVWQDAAYATPTLDAELSRAAQLDSRERALCTQLTYGVLRCETALMQLLRQHTPNRRWEKKPALRARLLIAAFSLYALDRIPAYAAVNAAVQATRRHDGQRVAGFCNAVLRKLSRQRPDDTQAWLQHAVVQSVPRWLRKRLRAQLGDDITALLSPTAAPPMGICLRQGEDRTHWLAKLRQAAPAAKVTLSPLSPRAIRLYGAGDLRKLPGATSAWRVQEEGAQLVALALQPRPATKVLDACAGNGGKTLLLHEVVGAGGRVDAVDKHPRKLARLQQAVGDAAGDSFAQDWRLGVGDVPDDYHAALVDAPCSATGTLRRRPELLRRLSRAQLNDLQALQRTIVQRVASRVRHGGTLLYAVCSLLRDEAEEVLEPLRSPHNGIRLQPCPFTTAPFEQLAAGGHSFRLMPHLHGTDGYFVAKLRVCHT